MKLLALDTSTEYLSIALDCEGEIRSRDWLAQQKHAELTLPEIQKLVADAGISLKQLDGIALSIGPGGFTGLRIGCGIAQGLALGLDLPCVGINSLAAMAADSGADRVLCALDARMGEYYLAAFTQLEEGWQTCLATQVCGPDSLPELAGTGWLGIGSGFGVGENQLGQHYGSQLRQVDTSRFPHARGTLKLAKIEFAAGRSHHPDELLPLYIRDKVALKSSERIKTV